MPSRCWLPDLVSVHCFTPVSRRGEMTMSKNIVGDFVRKKMEQKNLSRRDVVDRMAYRNRSKAFKLLDAVLFQGRPGDNRFFDEQLCGALEIDPVEYSQACEADRVQKQRECDAEMRAVFHPHLWAVTERPIPEFSLSLMMGEFFFRGERLPDDIASRPMEEQQSLVRAAVSGHLASRKALGGPFGKTLSYLYRFTYDDYYEVDLDGNIGDLCHKPVRWGVSGVSADGRMHDAGEGGIPAAGVQKPAAEREKEST